MRRNIARWYRRLLVVAPAVALSAGVVAAAGAVAWRPLEARAQAGIFCPDNGTVVIQHQGSTYTGYAVETEGWGLNSTYEFRAVDLGGNTISGTAEANIIDCITTPPGGFVDLHNIQITGYSSGGPINV